MNVFIRQSLILVIGLVLGISLVIGSNVLARRDGQNALPFDDLRLFTEIFARIKNDYVKEVDDKQLLEQAIGGMVSGLDPHSAFLNEESFKDMQIGTTGQFGGLGIEVSMEDGFVKVISPIDDTPAQRAGVKAGDLVIRLDDKSVKGMSLGDAVKVMRGKPGTAITLTIVREGEDKPLKIEIIRAVIKVQSVKSRVLDKNFGYIRISQFQSKTGDDLIKKINKLRDDVGGDLRGLVLDLRNNPGGVLSAAVSVSDAFVEKGLIVYTEGRSKESEIQFNATPGDILSGAPLVVLVNSGSASASEIVAGALQDHKRGVIMGKKTFGKGSVQTIIPMFNNTAVKLTTALYYTPNGRSIQAEGIEPDIVLENVQVTSRGKEPVISRLKEADLARHLNNGSTKDKNKNKKNNDKKNKNKKNNNKSASKEAKKQPLASRDYALYEALNLLKGMTMLHIRMRKTGS
ncbi:MAG: proteolytic complex protein CptA [Gammaproteobacteria bacterium]|nr:MAG: proteolytic complex protein CptA [Gammaproteobacteria bacterium]